MSASDKLGITLEVEGLAELEKAMQQFEANIQLRVISSAARASAKPVLKRAKANLQRRSSPSSGALAESLGIKKVSRRFSGNAVSYLVAPIENNKTAAAQYKAFYGRGGYGIYHGHFVEFGVPGKTRAQPYLRPAGAAAAGDSKAEFLRFLKRGVTREARKAARLSR